MNKYQEALNRLKIKSLYYADTLTQLKATQVEEEIKVDKKTLQELVDRATPIKPIYREFMKGTPLQEWKQVCPSCKVTITYENLGKNYCPECGQAIDWSENE